MFYLGGLDTFKKIILEGRGFRGGSDKKMRRMWLGIEIAVAGLPPLLCSPLSLKVKNRILIGAVFLPQKYDA